MSPLTYEDLNRVTFDYPLRDPIHAAEAIYAAASADTDTLHSLRDECEKRGLDMEAVFKEVYRLFKREENILKVFRGWK